MNTSMKKSEKLNILTQNDFDKLQQSRSETANKVVKPIKNSKYKKSHQSSVNEIDLLSYLKEKNKKPKDKLKFKKIRYVIGSKIVKPSKAKRWKVREDKKKKHTTLKKAILRFRDEKKEVDPGILQLTEQLKDLTLPPNPTKLHSRRFRNYCDNCTTMVLCELTEKLLRDLDRFQKRAHQQNEIKAHAKRRFVIGFRECFNFLRINKAKLVIIAPDCEESTGEAGLDATIRKLKVQCVEKTVPYMFSLNRRKLSYVLYKKASISCVCILDYDGCFDTFNRILEALNEARNDYQKLAKPSSIQMDS